MLSSTSMLSSFELFFIPLTFSLPIYSTWTEFASDVNGKKLSKLVGQTDEEKLIDLCNAIDRQVQQLRPYQPIAKSQVLSKLCCRIPHHDKRPLFVACSGESQPRFPRAVAHTRHLPSYSPWPAVQRVHVRAQPNHVQHPASEACRDR